MTNGWKRHMRALASLGCVATLMSATGSAAFAQQDELDASCVYEGEVVCRGSNGETLDAFSAKARGGEGEDGLCAMHLIVEVDYEDATCRGTFESNAAYSASRDDELRAYRDGQYDRRDISIILNDNAVND